MKKWIIALSAAVIVGIAAIVTQLQTPAKAEPLTPDPLIKFNGSTVEYAPNMPDCH
ncbi:YdgA family protein [Paenibacillus sp. CC-CFT747]|nr:YdgA family protein [Paenibacillus sp. CC-CFT747]